jgi:cytochrome c oxidase subunit 2
MTPTRRSIGLFLVTAGTCLVAAPSAARLTAQEQAPNRPPPINIVARDFRFSPDRVEVTQDDLVKLTVRSEDVAYGFTIDKFRISKRVPAGQTMTVEFRADQAGTAEFYSNMTSDPRHAQMRGQLIVRGK